MARKEVPRFFWYAVVSPAALLLGCYLLSFGWLATRQRGHANWRAELKRSLFMSNDSVYWFRLVSLAAAVSIVMAAIVFVAMYWADNHRYAIQ